MMLMGLSALVSGQGKAVLDFPVPEAYYAFKAVSPIVIDGKIDEAAWSAASWSNSFVDIEGDKKPLPHFDTKMKVLWDDSCLYFAAKMEEPHLWGTITEDESIIYFDNDFEIFLDPDGDNHCYYEFEINTLGADWDLFLNYPYNDGGQPVTSWDIKGLKSAVYCEGTVNDAGDIDTAWYVEVAMPWRSLITFSGKKRNPITGDIWRMNFSRVQYDLDIQDGGYLKRKDSLTGKTLPERNWVWSPQHEINMHNPETWGYLVFADKGTDTTVYPDPDFHKKLYLVKLYRQQYRYKWRADTFATKAEQLTKDLPWPVEIETNSEQFFIKIKGEQGVWYIDHKRRIWRREW